MSSVLETKWSEYVTRFIFGGLVTLLAGVIADHYGPNIGGLFLAFPAIFPASSSRATVTCSPTLATIFVMLEGAQMRNGSATLGVISASLSLLVACDGPAEPARLIAFAGAGGKTTAIFQLARALSAAEGQPTVVSATSHLGTWQIPLADAHVIAGQPGDCDQRSGGRRRHG